jgi:hypothetical protein
MLRRSGFQPWAKRFTSHCKKNSNLSESSKSRNGDLQHLREMTLRSG